MIKHRIPGWQRREKSQAGREKLGDAWIRGFKPGSRSKNSNVRGPGNAAVSDRSGAFQCGKEELRCEDRGWETRKLRSSLEMDEHS